MLAHPPEPTRADGGEPERVLVYETKLWTGVDEAVLDQAVQNVLARLDLDPQVPAELAGCGRAHGGSVGDEHESLKADDLVKEPGDQMHGRTFRLGGELDTQPPDQAGAGFGSSLNRCSGWLRWPSNGTILDGTKSLAGGVDATVLPGRPLVYRRLATGSPEPRP
jgi:hypothetical protein